MATLRGETVDRPPVSFYELNGLDENPNSEDPFNIYSDPSWTPLLELTRDKTDRIVMRSVPFRNAPPDPLDEITTIQTYYENGSLFTRRTVKVGNRTLTSLSRRDPDVNTIWEIEHLLKDPDDLRVWLELPAPELGGEPDISVVLQTEAELGDTGIVVIDTPDPLCLAASSPAEIAHPLDLRLGESIRLMGYDLPRPVVKAGGVVELTLYWQATASVPARYKVFTHLVGQTYNTATGGFLWGRQDDEPANGQAVTTSWVPGTVIADPHSIPVAADTPPGRYTLEVGLYRLVDGTRLPVFGSDERSLGDAVILAQVEVQAP